MPKMTSVRKIEDKKTIIFTQNELKTILTEWCASRGLNVASVDKINTFMDDEACTVTLELLTNVVDVPVDDLVDATTAAESIQAIFKEMFDKGF